MIKLGKQLFKVIAIVTTMVFAGSFLMGAQVASETAGEETDSADAVPKGHSVRDELFASWLEKNAAFIKPGKEELKQTLTPVQYDVTQEEGTERPFQNEYWNNQEEGLYVDIVSGEPLFSSTDKFTSGTGWPSFTQAISQSAVTTEKDLSIFGIRTELRSRVADSHLGHVFDDGPAPTGQRYCINSASLKFVPKDKLVEEGYAEFVSLFK